MNGVRKISEMESAKQASAPSQAAASAKATTITMPHDGKVKNVSVKVGENVLVGSALFTVELDGKEGTIFAPCSGNLKTLSVKVGDDLKASDKVAEIA